MKISKIPGLGRFGHFIDNLDFNTLTDEQWMEIGQLHLNGLVTIIRNANISVADYEARMNQWGTTRVLQIYRLLKKYQPNTIADLLHKDQINGVPVAEEDRSWVQHALRMMAEDDGQKLLTVLRVSGIKDSDGQPMGMFAEGELLWHSNESGNLCFAPGVALYGHSGVQGSATGFVTTVDWYECQSNSFRSELDEMIVEHQFIPGRINPGLNADQDFIMYKNMCPEDRQLPLVMTSPGGHRGLHYSVNTITGIKGMTAEESRAVFDQINTTLFVPENIYDHWYANDRDICLFDNSITLHRRLGGIASRMCYRIQYDQGVLAPNYNPYTQEPWASEYAQVIKDVNQTCGIDHKPRPFAPLGTWNPLG
jgi:alpha-ketoglutarate-dependent taurine dioxygenase